MNPLDAREAEETYEYPARPYTLPMRPVQSFRVLSESGDVPSVGETAWDPYKTPENAPTAQTTGFKAVEDWETDGNPFSEDAWSDKYLTAEDARVLRQDGM